MSDALKEAIDRLAQHRREQETSTKIAEAETRLSNFVQSVIVLPAFTDTTQAFCRTANTRAYVNETGFAVLEFMPIGRPWPMWPRLRFKLAWPEGAPSPHYSPQENGWIAKSDAEAWEDVELIDPIDEVRDWADSIDDHIPLVRHATAVWVHRVMSVFELLDRIPK